MRFCLAQGLLDQGRVAGDSMTAFRRGSCRFPGCSAQVPLALRVESVCLDHFLESTFLRAERTMQHCQQGLPLRWPALDWLFSVAEFTVRGLAAQTGHLSSVQREKALELLLCLANIREYIRQRSIHITPAA